MIILEWAENVQDKNRGDVCMFLSTRNIPAEQLIALKFSANDFRLAARLAVENEIPVDAPGYNTLIIRKCDRKLFETFTLEAESGVTNPEMVKDY